jgi:ferrous iron transport protein A
MNETLRSLAQLGQGSCAVVRELGGGRTFSARLASMGLSVGSLLMVLQNRGHGPLLVLVRDTRIALGRGEAMKVMVEEQACERVQSEA